MHMICISLQSFIRRWACICLASPAYMHITRSTHRIGPHTFFSVHIAMFANHLMSQASKALNDMNETTLGGHHSILDKPKDVGVSLQQK